MGVLSLAKTDIKRIDLDDTDWIEVKTDLSKRTMNALLTRMPLDVDAEKGLTVEQGLAFQTALFEVLVTGWSLDVPCTVDNYLELGRAAGEAVDSAVSNHFSSLTPTRDESTKSN